MNSPSSERTSDPELAQLFPWNAQGGYTTVLFPGIPTRAAKSVTRLGFLGGIDCSRFRHIETARPLILFPSVAVIILGMVFRFEAHPVFSWIIWVLAAHMCIDYAARGINRLRERRFLRNWGAKALVGPSEIQMLIRTLHEAVEAMRDDREATSIDPRGLIEDPDSTERQLIRIAALLRGAPTITPMELHAIAVAIYEYRETRSEASAELVLDTYNRHRPRPGAADSE